MRLSAFLTIATALVAASARAEPAVLPGTEVVPLASRINGVNYRLLISAPPGHEQRTGGIQAVLLLDADYSFPIAHAIGTHLRERRDLPDLLLVSIGYEPQADYRLNRTRDYTPTLSDDPGAYGPEYQKHSGGGPKFLAFIETELMPLLHARYRAAPRPLLVGHSFGGLFAIWALLTRPESLAGAISVSPSLWYDDDFLPRVEAGLPEARRALPRKLYAAVGALEGNGNHDMVAGLIGLKKRLTRRRYPKLQPRIEVLGGETHNSVFPRALSNGLRYFWPRGAFEISKAPGTR